MTDTTAVTGTYGGAWIRCPRRVPEATVRLVCFPHAGGSATFFLPVATALRDHPLLGRKVEVLAVQYPGRQDRRREQPITDLRRLADEAAEALRPWAGDRLVFFGHSMGACVAFEVARRTAAEPAALVVSGRRAPSRRRIETVHRRDDEGIVRELRALSGTDPSLLADEELLRLVLPAVRADYTAVERYECGPDAVIGSPITAFVGDDDPQVTLEEAHAWSEHTTGAFEMRVFEGGHFFLTSSPGLTIDRLAEVLLARA